MKQKIMMHKMTALGLLFLGMAFCFGYARLQVYPFIVQPEINMVADSKLFNFMALDHKGFVADMLFIKVNLHSGSLMWKPLYINFDSRWAYAMMEVITNLDPKFYNAYLFSAMGLIHNFEDIRLAEPILKKGMEQFPDSWELPFWAGYGYYNYLMEYKTASEYMWSAYSKPNAPKYYVALMLSAMQKSGRFDRAAIAMQALMDNTKNSQLKIIYAKKIVRLNNLDRIMKASEQFRIKNGKYPNKIDELISPEYLVELPEDPDGLGYAWDNEKKLPRIMGKAEKGSEY